VRTQVVELPVVHSPYPVAVSDRYPSLSPIKAHNTPSHGNSVISFRTLFKWTRGYNALQELLDYMPLLPEGSCVGIADDRIHAASSSLQLPKLSDPTPPRSFISYKLQNYGLAETLVFWNWKSRSRARAAGPLTYYIFYYHFQEHPEAS
jgi:hypothetical protein